MTFFVPGKWVEFETNLPIFAAQTLSAEKNIKKGRRRNEAASSNSGVQASNKNLNTSLDQDLSQFTTPPLKIFNMFYDNRTDAHTFTSKSPPGYTLLW